MLGSSGATGLPPMRLARYDHRRVAVHALPCGQVDIATGRGRLLRLVDRQRTHGRAPQRAHLASLLASAASLWFVAVAAN